MCIPAYKLCNLADDCGDASDEDPAYCASLGYLQYSFESESPYTNLFTQDTSDDIDWEVGRGEDNVAVAPRFDHTHFDQYSRFLYLPLDKGEKSNVARLITKPLMASKTCRPRFFYHMYGHDVGALQVWARYEDGHQVGDRFVQTENELNIWKPASLEGFNALHPFEIVVEGSIGMSSKGDIAIDDFTLSPGCSFYTGPWNGDNVTTSGPTTDTTQPGHQCKANEFFCPVDKTCIPIEFVNNFRRDCGEHDLADEENCPGEICTFENRTRCNWEIINQPRFKWELSQGRTAGPPTIPKPTEDTSLHSDEGYYMWVNDTSDSPAVTEMMTFTLGHVAPSCKLRFNFWLAGNPTGEINVFLRNESDQWIVGHYEGDYGSVWNTGVVFIGNKVGINVVLQASRGDDYAGGLAVDDVMFEDCKPGDPLPPNDSCGPNQFPCADHQYCIPNDELCDYNEDCFDSSDETPSNCHSYQYRCNFETPCDVWQQDSDDQLSWQRIRGSTDSIGTGPIGDHTLGTLDGYFLYIESDPPASPNDTARMSSYVFKGGATGCRLRFFWHMRGEDAGDIKIYKRTSFLENGITVLDKIKASESEGIWQRKSIDLDQDGAHDDYEIVLEGNIGAAMKGDIALDDITFTYQCQKSQNQILPGENTPTANPNPCNETHQFECGDGSCYSQYQLCNFIPDCSTGADEDSCSSSCDFETGEQCHWGQDMQDTADWQVVDGDIGQGKDHTFGNSSGHFMLVMSHGGTQTGKVAILQSTTFSSSGPQCKISFYYQMTSSSSKANQLSVFTKSSTNADIIFNTQQDTATWTQGSGNILKNNQFEIFIQASLGDGLASVKLDDLTLVDCEPDHQVTECPPNQMMCKSGDQCVDLVATCDKKLDCSDGSDEQDCVDITGDCSFENDTCEWTQNYDDDFNFKRIDSSESGEGPSSGHTVSRGSSNYFLMSNVEAEEQGAMARLSSPTYPASTGACFMRFFYYMHSTANTADKDGMGQLSVYTEDSHGGRRLMWYRSLDQGDGWHYARAAVSANTQFKVVFEATRGETSHSNIAIDDITFTDGKINV